MARRKDNLSSTSNASDASTSKVHAIPEKSNELPKDIPIGPLAEEEDTPAAEVFPVPSVSEDCDVENEEQ